MAFDPATQTKIALETASYHPFAALLSLLQAADGRPDLAGVRACRSPASPDRYELTETC